MSTRKATPALSTTNFRLRMWAEVGGRAREERRWSLPALCLTAAIEFQ